MKKTKGKKKGMKYFYSALISLLMVLSSAKAADNIFSTNVLTAGFNSQTFALITNRANLKQITLTGTQGGTFKLFDENRLTAPYSGTNYVTASNISIASYATNIVNTIISETGYTNYMTNSYVFTYPVTNSAATNALSPVAMYAIAANTVLVEDVNLLFVRGIVGVASTNMTVILRYNSGQ